MWPLGTWIRVCLVALPVALASGIAPAQAGPVIGATEDEDVTEFGTYNQNVIGACKNAAGVSSACGLVATFIVVYIALRLVGALIARRIQ